MISIMRSAVTSRIRITRKGKVVRRKMGQGHCLAKVNNNQASRRKTTAGLVLANKIIKKMMY